MIKIVHFWLFLCIALSKTSSASSASTGSYFWTTFAGRENQPDGHISTAWFGIRYQGPDDIVIAGDGTVYVADSGTHSIRKIDRNGIVSTFAGQSGHPGHRDGPANQALFGSPHYLALDPAGNLFVAEGSNHTIRKITPQGIVSTVAGSPRSSGNADGPGNEARFNAPSGLAFDVLGNLFVADSSNNTIRKISPDGNVSTIAGLPSSIGAEDGLGELARFNHPKGLCLHPDGTLIVSDRQNHTIRRVTTSGLVTTIAGIPGMRGFSEGSALSSKFDFPVDVIAAPDGRIFVTDNHQVRQIGTDGNVTSYGHFQKLSS